ncbi:MAG: cell division protein ZapE [Rickettsiales bacterium]|nr:MAG: cell division protein ZapE [Rickettsiales bacterium]
MLEIALVLDEKQREILSILEKTAIAIKEKTFFSVIKSVFNKQNVIKSIYLHGLVGRGKTMLMKKFFENVKVSKEIIHYQKFMFNVHQQMHLLNNIPSDQIVQNLAHDIAKKAQVICLDEFEIKDITDAMIIMNLVKYLLDEGVLIFITTNTIPDNLYKDGLQRESFLPFIDLIKSKFQILDLDSATDYRYSNKTFEKRILSPRTVENEATFNNIKAQFQGESTLVPVTLKLFGRELFFATCHHNILFTNFTELFERDVSYADYIKITEHFSIIIVENVKKIDESDTNIATRFINFIDNAYFNKVLLFMQVECRLTEIYQKGFKTNEFKRTLSRLNEMNSAQYINNTNNG